MKRRTSRRLPPGAVLATGGTVDMGNGQICRCDRSKKSICPEFPWERGRPCFHCEDRQAQLVRSGGVLPETHPAVVAARQAHAARWGVESRASQSYSRCPDCGHCQSCHTSTILYDPLYEPSEPPVKRRRRPPQYRIDPVTGEFKKVEK